MLDSQKPDDEPLLAAAREEFIRHGLRRAAVGDIARRAGVTRMTINRRLGDKDAIARAVVAREVVDFFARAVTRFDSVASPAERVAETFVAGVVELRNNPLARAALEYDGDAFFAMLTGNRQEFDNIRDLVALGLAGDEVSSDEAKRISEIALRLTATLLVAPSDLLPLNDAQQARRFANAYLQPLVEAARSRS